MHALCCAAEARQGGDIGLITRGRRNPNIPRELTPPYCSVAGGWTDVVQ